MASRRTIVASAVLVTLSWGAAPPAWSQGVLDSVAGPDFVTGLGQNVAGLGDIDGDGRPDLAVASPTLANDQQLPRVDVFSGDGMALLAQLEGTSDLDGFGTGLASAGDVNGDGVGDLIVGAPEVQTLGRGYVKVYSGVDGAVLLTLVGSNLFDRFGTAVAGLGDVNGDGLSDLAVGAPGVNGLLIDAGRVRAFSGADGSVLWSVTGTAPDEQLGGVVTALGDLDGDGVGDVGIAPSQTFAGVFDVVHVHSGTNGAFLFDLTGPQPGERFGSAIAAGGDVDRDGTPDVIVGAPDNDTFGSRAGAGYAVSGDDGAVIHAVFGTTFSAALGTSVAGRVDVDADGWFDYAVGVPWMLSQAGEVWMISGRDGTVLATRSGDDEDSGLGTSVAGLGDVNGDGFDEILAGDPTVSAGKGVAKVLTFRLAPPPIGVFAGGTDDFLGEKLAGGSDFDGDGISDLVATLASDGGLVALSGADQTLIWSDAAGRSDVALIADLDLDGVDDVLTLTATAVRVLSGADGSEITSLSYPPDLPVSTVVASAGDLDGDGVEDIIAGSPNVESRGAAVVWSGATGAVIHELTGDEVINEGFASDVSGVGDLDGDGVDDLIVGARGTSTVLGGAGRVWALSGADGSTLFQVEGTVLVERLGSSVEGFVDVTGDGIPEFLAGAPSQANFGGNPGRVLCLSGADGSLVWDLHGEAVGFAADIAAGGDFDGDGVPDALVGSTSDFTGGLGVGAVFVLSGVDGTVLRQILGPNGPGESYPQLGHPCGLGDIDGDGIADLAIGALGASLGGDHLGGVFFHSGRVPSWTGQGLPTAGTWGTPNLYADGDLLPGAPFTLQLGGFLEAQPVTLLVGLSELGAPFKGGTLVPAPDILVNLFTDADGGASLPAIWPGGVPAGVTLWFQAWMVDAAGPAGFSASNGLRGVVP